MDLKFYKIDNDGVYLDTGKPTENIRILEDDGNPWLEISAGLGVLKDRYEEVVEAAFKYVEKLEGEMKTGCYCTDTDCLAETVFFYMVLDRAGDSIDGGLCRECAEQLMLGRGPGYRMIREGR